MQREMQRSYRILTLKFSKNEYRSTVSFSFRRRVRVEVKGEQMRLEKIAIFKSIGRIVPETGDDARLSFLKVTSSSLVNYSR